MCKSTYCSLTYTREEEKIQSLQCAVSLPQAGASCLLDKLPGKDQGAETVSPDGLPVISGFLKTGRLNFCLKIFPVWGILSRRLHGMFYDNHHRRNEVSSPDGSGGPSPTQTVNQSEKEEPDARRWNNAAVPANPSLPIQ
jgi:hypothetical protein